MTLYLAVVRERNWRSPSGAARFRLHVAAQPRAHSLLISARLCSSVNAAKRDAETLFGPLDWREPDADQPDTRAAAILELDR